MYLLSVLSASYLLLVLNFLFASTSILTSVDLSRKPLSIGYYCPVWPPGAFPSGIATYVSTLSRQLRMLGHEVTILANLANGTVGMDHPPELYSLGLSEHVLEAKAWNRIPLKIWQRVSPSRSHHYLYRRALAMKTAEAIRERGIQIVEIEESFGWANSLQQALPIPVCVRLHGPWFRVGTELGYPRNSQFRRRVNEEGKAIARAAGVSAPARDVLERTRDHYGTPLPNARVIPNPVESTHELWNVGEVDPRRIVFIGRFDRLKGGDLIINAFQRVLSQVPNAKLWFIGPDQGCLTSDGRKLGLIEYVRNQLPGVLESKQVEWLGQQPNQLLAHYRRRALACVVCSLYETFPYVVAEAMALGCPVIAANVGGIPELLQHQRNGLLHEPGNAEDLALKIITLMRDTNLAVRLGQQAAIDCRDYLDPVRIAEQTVSFYRSLIGERECSATRR